MAKTPGRSTRSTAGRMRKGVVSRKPHKIRQYEGMTPGSTCHKKKTPASLYTHYLDRRESSDTYNMRIEIGK